MLMGLFALVVLALFACMPLAWLALGVPWMTLVITFVLIPLADAWVGPRGARRCRRCRRRSRAGSRAPI